MIKELGFNSVTGCVLRFVKHEAERRRLAVRAVKGAGLWRSSDRSEDPLQKKRADQAQCLARKGKFGFMARAGKEGARSAQGKFEQPILS